MIKIITLLVFSLFMMPITFSAYNANAQSFISKWEGQGAPLSREVIEQQEYIPSFWQVFSTQFQSTYERGITFILYRNTLNHLFTTATERERQRELDKLEEQYRQEILEKGGWGAKLLGRVVGTMTDPVEGIFFLKIIFMVVGLFVCDNKIKNKRLVIKEFLKMRRNLLKPPFNLPVIIYWLIVILLLYPFIFYLDPSESCYIYMEYDGEMFKFTKIAVFGISAFLAYKNFCLPPQSKSIWAWIFFVVAITFNPFISVITEYTITTTYILAICLFSILAIFIQVDKSRGI